MTTVFDLSSVTIVLWGLKNAPLLNEDCLAVFVRLFIDIVIILAFGISFLCFIISCELNAVQNSLGDEGYHAK